MTYEYKVEEQNLAGARAVEDRLNDLAKLEWDFVQAINIGPMVRLVFRREKK